MSRRTISKTGVAKMRPGPKCINNLVYLTAVLVLAGCGGSGGSDTSGPPAASCGPYLEQATSLYVLPYEVGTGHEMVHGNCTVEMPIGTILVAARAGEVSAVEQSYMDSTRIPGEENFVIITHDDGTHGRYFHITQNGSMVAVGQMVDQGDPIALSGDTGESRGPHLHFVVEPAGESPLVPRGGTPVTFLNTVPHPNGLREGTVYVADPYPGCNCAS